MGSSTDVLGSFKKDYRYMLEQALGRGWSIEHSAGKHHKIVSPGGTRIPIPSSASDIRSIDNMKAQLLRYERDHPEEFVVPDKVVDVAEALNEGFLCRFGCGFLVFDEIADRNEHEISSHGAVYATAKQPVLRAGASQIFWAAMSDLRGEWRPREAYKAAFNLAIERGLHDEKGMNPQNFAVFCDRMAKQGFIERIQRGLFRTKQELVEEAVPRVENWVRVTTDKTGHPLLKGPDGKIYVAIELT